jgi:xanthine dehydrogenase accessory factor
MRSQAGAWDQDLRKLRAVMRDLFRTLSDALEARRPVAYCRLVETRGSTPQKAGALMLVFADGSQAGTLGGGCVEAEVKRQALARLHDGQTEIATFQLDSDYGWDDGLICGGRMKVLVAPISGDAPQLDYFRQFAQRVLAGQGLTEAVAFDSDRGITAPGAWLFDAEGKPLASLVSCDLPDSVARELRSLTDRPRPYATQGIAYLPVLPRCRLLIVGGGHVGRAVANLAAQLEFDIWVVDDREDIVSAERFPTAEKRIAGNIDAVLPGLEITPHTYCLIVTRGHNHDEEALFHLADRAARYVGLIGSRRKIKLIFEDLLEKGVSREALERVHAPLGIDIGSQTVPEIAVSICAELVAHRNRGEVPGRPRSVEF